MANNYYTRSKTFTTGTKAKGSDVVAELDSILAGFDLLPTPDQLESGSLNYVTPGGTGDAITFAAPQTTWTTYTGKDGYEFTLQIASNNSGAVTVNVDSLGAVALKRSDAAALQANDLVTTASIDIAYNESAGVFYVKQTVASIVTDQVAAAPAVLETGIVKATGVAFEGTVADGDAVYWDAGNNRYAKAIADGSAAQNLVGFADVTNTKVELSGVMSALTTGLTAGSVYYLSTSVAGDISTTAGAVKAGVARTATALLIDIGSSAQTPATAIPNTITANTTLTVSSSRAQIADGHTAEISITLPDATTLTEGAHLYLLMNRGGDIVTVFNDSGVTIGSVKPGYSDILNLIDNSTADGEWMFDGGFSFSQAEEVSFDADQGGYCSSALLDTDKTIVCYAGTGGEAVIVSTSTLVPTTGTTAQFEAGVVLYVRVVALSTTKALVVYSDNGNSDFGTACVLDVSGTTITPGTPWVFESGTTAYMDATELTSTTAIVTWREVTSSDLASIVLSVSGTTISKGTKDTITTTVANANTGIAKLSATKVMSVYGASNSKTVVILDIAGTAITAGTPLVLTSRINSSASSTMISALDSTTAIVASRDDAWAVTVSGSTLTEADRVYIVSDVNDFDGGGESVKVSSTQALIIRGEPSSSALMPQILTYKDSKLSASDPYFRIQGYSPLAGSIGFSSIGGTAVLLSARTSDLSGSSVTVVRASL